MVGNSDKVAGGSTGTAPESDSPKSDPTGRSGDGTGGASPEAAATATSLAEKVAADQKLREDLAAANGDGQSATEGDRSGSGEDAGGTEVIGTVTGRGAITVDIDYSQDERLIGGQLGALVTITNPFDVPITIPAVHLILPPSFEQQPDPRNPSVKTPATLQPGNVTCVGFTVKRKQAWFSPPSHFTVTAVIQYVVDGATQSTVSTEMLLLRPSRWALTWGAIVGTLAGLIVTREADFTTLAQGVEEGSRGDWVLFFYSWVALSILSIILSVGSNSLTGFITVEDFVGAALVGFAVVVTGVSALDLGNQILPASDADATATAITATSPAVATEVARVPTLTPLPTAG